MIDQYTPRGVLKYKIFMDKFVAFLKDVKLEMGRVNWPTKDQTTKYTLVVIGMSIFLALFLGLLDSVFSYIINLLITR